MSRRTSPEMAELLPSQGRGWGSLSSSWAQQHHRTQLRPPPNRIMVKGGVEGRRKLGRLRRQEMQGCELWGYWPPTPSLQTVTLDNCLPFLNVAFIFCKMGTELYFPGLLYVRMWRAPGTLLVSRKCLSWVLKDRSPGPALGSY